MATFSVKINLNEKQMQDLMATRPLGLKKGTWAKSLLLQKLYDNAVLGFESLNRIGGALVTA